MAIHMTPKPRASYVRLAPDDRRAALIEAARACLGDGGIASFTVDQICARAGVSRGLISHYFGSMNALLAAVYTRMYAASLPVVAEMSRDQPLILSLLDHFFSPDAFNRQSLNIWLTLWAEISNNPDLRAAHRAQYPAYHQMVRAALLQAAPALDTADSLARSMICLVDGLGLQHCIDPDAMPAQAARQACLDHITPHIGPLT